MLSPASEARLQDVMPALADKIRQMAAILALDPEPIALVVSAGARTWAEQHALFLQGRSLPGDIVTDADGGQSWHCLGVAVDCEPEVVNGEIDWKASHPQWKRMEAVGVSLGLTTGANWIRLVDAPHFQLTGGFPVNAPNDEARQIYQNEGAAAFWAEVESSL
jgi:peptidoglycan L-alanyl-D-glutamate endopeptidase CwlK